MYGFDEETTLHVSVRNIRELNNLIEKAEKEARELSNTINRLKWFNLKIEFSTDSTTESDE